MRKSQVEIYMGFVIVKSYAPWPFPMYRVLGRNYQFIGCRDTLSGARQLALDMFNVVDGL